MILHENGVENVAEAMVKQTRKDFIKGVKVLYPILKRVPTQKELLADPLHKSLSNNESVRYMYDAWRFVQDDPYQFFGDVGEETVIKSWTEDAVEDYYRLLYLPGAAILYKKHIPKDKLPKIDIKEASEIFEDSVMGANFVMSRDYILGTINGHDKLRQWNIDAYARSKTIKGKKSAIQETEYFKMARIKREKNIEKAKDLFENGISVKAIAKELGVQISTVRGYLRS